jgi:hypothetical protein
MTTRHPYLLGTATFLLLLTVGSLVTFGALCSLRPWSIQGRPRFSQVFDIGGGRTLRVWSDRRGLVYYRIDADGQEVIHTTFLDHDDNGEYAFRMVSADGGRLVCVYEVTRAANNVDFLLMFDATADESWPRTFTEEGGYIEYAAAKWRERHRRLKADNPELPTPPEFAD